MLRYATLHVQFEIDFHETEEHGGLYKRSVRLYGISQYPTNESHLMRPLTPADPARRITTRHTTPINCVYSGNSELSSAALFRRFLQLNAAIPSLDTTEFVRLPFPLQFLYLVLKQ